MKRSLILLFVGLLFSPVALANIQVNVVGLFNNKAVLVINGGKPQTLGAGQVSQEGVKLVEANSTRAVLEIEGKRRELGMGQGASLPTSPTNGPASVTLYADRQGHFVVDGSINGRPVRMLVDTGASSVAISGAQAKKLGIDYAKGEPAVVSTAGGLMKSFAISLNSLKVGSLVLHQVEAVVIEGNSPPLVLLGMSALSRLQMKHEGIALTLTKKF